MSLFLSCHAVRQMMRRGITREEIDEALRNPEVTYASEDYPDERVVVLGRTTAGRRLKIVVEKADTNAVVTVAARDEEA